MKTLLGLLLIGLTTYPQANGDACNNRALDIISEGRNDKGMSFEIFVSGQGVDKYYVPWATINHEVDDAQYQQFCSGSLFSHKNCGVTYYERSILDKTSPQNFRSRINLYNHGKFKEEVTMLTMVLKLDSTTDYIFVAEDPNNGLKAYSYENKKTKELEVPQKIKETLGKRFALFYVSQNANISIYIMCDEPRVWASVKNVQILNEEATKEIADVFNKLKEFGVKESDTTYITPFNEKWSELFSKKN